MKISRVIKLGDYISLYVKLQLTKTQWVAGYSSLCEDGRHVILLDLENTLPPVVNADLADTVDKFDLTSFYVLESSGLTHGYQAVCPGKVDLQTYIQVMGYLYDAIEWPFITQTVRRGFGILRFGGKIRETGQHLRNTLIQDNSPEYRFTVSGREPRPAELSRVHTHLLGMWYGAESPFWRQPWLDSGKTLITEFYRTGIKRVEVGNGR